MNVLSGINPDQLLRLLEQRSDALLAAEDDASEQEMALKAWESSYFLTLRDAKIAVAEAEHRVRAAPQWSEMFRACAKARNEAAKVKRDYQRVVTAIDLWRTEQATRRTVG